MTPRTRLADVAGDLADETDALLSVLAHVGEEALRTPTPAAGWTVHDQVTHLAYFDDACHRAATDPAGFELARDALVARGKDFPDLVAADHHDLGETALRGWFGEARGRLLAALRTADGSERVPWFGPDMSITSAATARLMETWAHGRDIADALGREQQATDRLRHVAHLGVRTRDFSYSLRGLAPPAEPVRVELTAPSGAVWSWGPDDAANRVSGSAEEFCLVVVQRRHLSDTTLDVRGPLAAEWMSIAQAFAGEPGSGRRPSASRT